MRIRGLEEKREGRRGKEGKGKGGWWKRGRVGGKEGERGEGGREKGGFKIASSLESRHQR